MNYRRVPFKPAAQMGARTVPPNTRVASLLAPAAVKKAVPARMRLGNAGVSDFINTPGFPGSSTMFLYDGFDFGSFIKSAAEGIKTTAESVVPAVLQYRIADINIQRAKAGLAPIDVSTYAPSFQVGADPATLRTAQFGIGTIALLGLGGLALVLLLRRR